MLSPGRVCRAVCRIEFARFAAVGQSQSCRVVSGWVLLPRWLRAGLWRVMPRWLVGQWFWLLHGPRVVCRAVRCRSGFQSCGCCGQGGFLASMRRSLGLWSCFCGASRSERWLRDGFRSRVSVWLGFWRRCLFRTCWVCRAVLRIMGCRRVVGRREARCRVALWGAVAMCRLSCCVSLPMLRTSVALFRVAGLSGCTVVALRCCVSFAFVGISCCAVVCAYVRVSCVQLS